MNPSNPDGYVSPFDHPLFNVSASSIDGGSLLTILFFLIFAFWALYTVIAIYHWLRYSHRSWLAIPAIGTHVFVSGMLILYIANSLR